MKFSPWALSDLSPRLLVAGLGCVAWIAVAVRSVVGLLRRSGSALTASIALMAASATLLGVPMIIELLHRRSLPLSFKSLAVYSAFASLLTPLLLLLAGRRAYLAPPGGPLVE